MEMKTFSDWTYLEVSKWLNENGLPQDLREAFKGEVVYFSKKKIWTGEL